MAVEEGVPFGPERQMRVDMHVFSIGSTKSALDVWKEIEAKTKVQMAAMGEEAGKGQDQEPAKSSMKKIRWAPEAMVYEPKEVESISEELPIGQSQSTLAQNPFPMRVEAVLNGQTWGEKGKEIVPRDKMSEHLTPEGNRQV